MPFLQFLFYNNIALRNALLHWRMV